MVLARVARRSCQVCGAHSTPFCAACIVTKRPAVMHHLQERGHIAALPAACMRAMGSAAGRRRVSRLRGAREGALVH